MGLRKRLRKQGYVLMSNDRATSIINLRERLYRSDQASTKYWASHERLVAEIDEMKTVKFGVSVDLLKVKYKLAIERIAELENADE